MKDAGNMGKQLDVFSNLYQFYETQSMRLQKLRKRAARIIADVANDDGQETVLELLQW
jgi:hypothetical protein